MDIAMPIAVAAIAVGCTALGIAQDYVPALSAAMGKIPGLGKIKAKADGHAPAAAPAGAPGMPGMPGMPAPQFGQPGSKPGAPFGQQGNRPPFGQPEIGRAHV